jgi:hypothetical protein
MAQLKKTPIDDFYAKGTIRATAASCTTCT